VASRYQFRLSTYLAMVLLCALTVRGMLLIAWVIKVTG
jgi:hypothetical protein